MQTFATRTSTFCATFFPYYTKEWKQSNDDIKKIKSIKKIKETLIKVIRTKENSVFGVSDIYSIKLLTHLRLNFKVKFRHNSKYMINPMCNFGAPTETTIYYHYVADIIQFKVRSSFMEYINYILLFRTLQTISYLQFFCTVLKLFFKHQYRNDKTEH